MASVTLEHVSKRYRDVIAVRDLDLEIADGEFLMLIGPSGCGKTTVLRLIAGLEQPDQGTIRIDRQAVNDVAPGARNVAMVFENYALYPHLVVRRNLEFAMRLHHTPPAEMDQRVSAVAGSMELDRLLGRSPPGLAAGEAQHVAIGRALVRDPPSVFLLDDALSHLDAHQRVEARAELGRIHRELRTTMISVTHDQAEALAVGTRVAVMDAGELQQVDAPRSLYDHPVNAFVAGFVGSPAMNLVPMSPERDGDRLVLRAGAFTLPGPVQLAGHADGWTSTPVTVGIRPEHIRLGEPRDEAPGDGEAKVRGRCDLVEFLGHQVLVHVHVGEVELSALDDPARHVRPGDIVDCAIPLSRLHVFDGRTGRVLDASS
jgi:multiple sugar transport system ATP-binding protein